MESRGLVTILLAALGVCLLVIGIFIGRETTRPPEPIAQPTPPPQKPLPPIFVPPPAAPPAPPSAAPSAPSIDPAEKKRVADYFREVDRLQNVDVDNPEASAQALINGAAGGDTSGLDKLIQQARDAERGARALVPPPPCAAFHKKLLVLLADSREMAQMLARGFQSGDLSSLPSMMTRAQAEKSRQEALAHDEKELKRRYGL